MRLTYEELQPFTRAAFEWARTVFPGCQIVFDAELVKDAPYIAPEIRRSWRRVFAACARSVSNPVLARFYRFLFAALARGPK